MRVCHTDIARSRVTARNHQTVEETGMAMGIGIAPSCKILHDGRAASRALDGAYLEDLGTVQALCRIELQHGINGSSELSGECLG